MRSVAWFLAVCCLLVSTRADAGFHFMKIEEVFPGTPASPQAQYVMLRMYNSGQNFVSGHSIIVYNAAGTAVATYMFPGNVSNGPDQARILIGTAQVQTFFGVAPDLVMSSASLPLAGGKVCFDTVDCVSWGNYSGSNAGVGTPWNRVPPAGLVLTRALERRLDLAGSASNLDAGDDTDNSLTDFVLGTPSPINNAEVVGTIPASTCPNNIVEALEGCDDNNSAANDGCSGTCVVERCGDAIMNNVTETCDDANTTNGDGCDNNCKITACGNGVVTSPEVCDDGNAVSGDGCDTNCKVTACGNGITTAGETCDDGNLTSGDGCDGNCTPTGCGNSVVTTGEACDPPNGTTCSSTCQMQCTLPSQCADANPCTTNERCDNMMCAVDATPTNDSEPCTVDGCDSNGVFHNPVTNGTSCTLSALPTTRALCVAATCVVASCGDGFVDAAAPGGPEECDDGNTVNNDACTNACTSAACGDSIVQGTEQCDDGNALGNDGCSATCVMERCGDLLLQGTEQCDDGNTDDNDSCSALCALESCGDGIRQSFEQCDDGNTSAGDGCSASCIIEGCGDGMLQTGEECDDGNVADGDQCSAQCTRPDAGGCCDSSGRGSLALFMLALAVLAALTRRRRRSAV